MFGIRLCISLFAAGYYALPSGYVLHEKSRGSERQVFRRARVHQDHVIPVRIGLVQSNLDQGYDMLMDVAHPESQNYGKHWSKEQVAAFFAPSQASISNVTDWLSSNGIHLDLNTNTDKGWLAFDVPAKQAEVLFQTQFFEHTTSSGDTRLGCEEYHLPEHISIHVDYIRPGVALSPPMKKRQESAPGPEFAQNFGPGDQRFMRPPPESSSPFNIGQSQLQSGNGVCSSSSVTPDCIRALYNIPRGTASGDNSNLLGIYEKYASYSHEDLDLHFARYAPYIPPGTGPLYRENINGATSPSPQNEALEEADMDFEMAYPLIYPEQTVLYQDGTMGLDNNPTQTFLTGFLDYVDGSFCNEQEQAAGFQCGAGHLTKVVSISFTDTELILPQAAQIRVCNEIMKLSLQGTTFVVDSGDWGVASQSDASNNVNGCYNSQNPRSGFGTVFSPTFPNNCPYVLSVGATMIPPDGDETTREVAMYVPGRSTPSQGIYFTSSGGFSNYFSRPRYQDDAVGAYFSNYDPGYPYYNYNGYDLFSSSSNIGKNGGVYNRQGRGFPDVSANGVNFPTVHQGNFYYTVGTSLSTPLWASLLTVINAERLRQGKSSVGLVNPVLYSNPGAFNDITSGSNAGCGSKGFFATPGWDPLTGLGTPNYPALLEVFSNLP